MEAVIYTQRVEIVENYKERRDCSDQKIAKFIESCGFIPIPISSTLSFVEQFVDKIQPIGIILTGGNSLVKYGGNAQERDYIDRKLISLAEKRDIPIYGFCRGMQSILDYYGCQLKNVSGHVAVSHKISGKLGERIVNSFHNQACLKVGEPIEVLAEADDGVIEAIKIKNKRIIATMWHPEREMIFKQDDIQLLQKLFGKEDIME